MIDTTLIERLTELANREKKIKEYKRRLRIKGKVINKSITKNGNISLNVAKGQNKYRFTILKSHKERFALAERLDSGRSISIEGIPRFRTNICTRLNILEKGINEGKQTKLG